MALFTLHPLSVTLATSFSVVLVIVLAGVEMLDAMRERSFRDAELNAPESLSSARARETARKRLPPT